MSKIQIQKTGNPKIDAALENLKQVIESEKHTVTAIDKSGAKVESFFGLAQTCC